MPEELVSEELLNSVKPPEGKAILGYAVCAAPPDQYININQTCPLGHGNILSRILLYRLPKWHIRVFKADEYMMVTPAFGELYARTIAKKRELEGAIKTGLASAAQAVADYELLKHDERKYREVLDYFKEGKKQEHVLRALYVDRVDAYTGEGYSLITMAKRWPTIITDFIRMSELTKAEAMDMKKIRGKLAVSEAEATVLKTKNQLFKKWIELFFPDIKARYVRIKNLVEARRKSVDEYREWLKPYIEMFKRMEEKTEIKPSEFLTMPVLSAFRPTAFYALRWWCWRAFTPEEVGKPGIVEEEIDPYDDFVKEWKRKIEKKYRVTITDDMVREKIKGWKKMDPSLRDREAGLEPGRYYYMFWDIFIPNYILKTEVEKFGEETGTEDQYFEITGYVISQNVLLILLIELEAKRMALERYVKELIGVKEVEEEIRKEVEEEFIPEEEKIKKLGRLKSVKDFIGKIREFNERVRGFGRKIKLIIRPAARAWPLRYFIKPGPYEHLYYERISKLYSRYMEREMTSRIIDYIIKRMIRLAGEKVYPR